MILLRFFALISKGKAWDAKLGFELSMLAPRST